MFCYLFAVEPAIKVILIRALLLVLLLIVGGILVLR